MPHNTTSKGHTCVLLDRVCQDPQEAAALGILHLLLSLSTVFQQAHTP